MLRPLFSRALFVFLMLLASIEIARATDVILSHQGRLLDSSDQPVNGPTTMTFRLYDQPTGGIALWTETQVGVQVTNGLFDSPLGSVTPLSVDVLTPAGLTPDRWLGVSIAGVELLPRMLLGTVPVAASSKRVTGDIVTGPGSLALADFNSDGRIDMHVSPESTYTAWVQDNSPNAEHFARLKVVDASSQLNLNHPDASSTMLANSAGGGIRLGGMSGSTTGTIRMMAAADSTTDYLDVDSDGDGIPESSDRRTISSNQVHHNVISRSGSTTGTIRMVASPDSTTDVLDSDSDGDGISESSLKNKSTPTGSSSVLHGMSGSTTGTIRMAASPDSASSSIECDADNDGIPESSAKLKALVAGTTSIIGSRSGSTTATIRMATKPDSTIGSWDCDADNDGLPESSYRIVNDGGGKRADVVMSGRSGSTTGTIRMAAAGGGGPILPSSSLDLEADLDGDGTMENSCRSIAAGAIAGIVVSSRFGSGPRQTTSMDGSFSRAAMECSSDTDNDGIADNSCAAVVTPTTSNLAIKTKGTSAQRQSASMGTDAAGTATFECSLDDDADGIAEWSVGGDCDDTDASFAVKGGGGGGGGGALNSVQFTVDAQGPVVELTTPATSSAIRFEVDATGPSIRMTNSGTIKSDIDGSGNAYFSSKLGVGVPAPTHQIDVTGGAYCDGANWVNASDKNAKENFQEVNGEELLKKISELDITKWNYKSDKETEHIGPTAQDFKETFGVGSDGKSISTIDPSGIALAAIKELYTQLKSKDKELAELRAEMAKMKKEIAKKN